ncbi:hypothetical protein GGTG_06743 [Gaeumannomyces tritici R3-111a-1]|uniref:Uncharacterized protein n=1 Tax=Gaeumannomyces tritici (strain R3-111a-1) TaxID=644352 RepID=J3NZP6_GAET3|nr:hypothetical protein GGTG_06743 [Gaeumannomyces tritici R3-111a-1]EJT76829.1 hypothetical protein GGTG_06743 [Gaeumannomyces tritici R3-111a-1]
MARAQARDPERGERGDGEPRDSVWSTIGLIFIVAVALAMCALMGVALAQIIMTALGNGNGPTKRDVVVPTNPGLLVHGFPAPAALLANHTGGSRTHAVVQVRSAPRVEEDEGAEAEQAEAESAADLDLDLDSEAAADAAEAGEATPTKAKTAAAAAQRLPTMAPLTIVEVYEPQTRTATISYWPDMAEPTSVMIQPARPTIKLRPGIGGLQPWWHRPQVTPKIPSGEPKATAQATAAAAAAAKATAQQTTSTATTTTTSARHDMWGTPVSSSVTAFMQAGAAATHKTTSVFYTVSRRPGRGRVVPVKWPTAVPAAKNATTAVGSVARPASAPAAAGGGGGGDVPTTAASDKSAAGFEKANENHTSSSSSWDVVASLDDPRAKGRLVVTYAKDERILEDWAARGVDFVDGRTVEAAAKDDDDDDGDDAKPPASTAPAKVVGRPAMVLADGTVVVHRRPSGGNKTAGSSSSSSSSSPFKDAARGGPAPFRGVAGPGPVVASSGDRALLNVTRAAASVAAAHQSGEITSAAV